MNPQEEKIVESLTKDKEVRRRITSGSLTWFTTIFLHEYIAHDFAPFHHEMFTIAEDPKWKFISIMAFRGSGKSTILNTAYALWSVLGIRQKKFVVVISETPRQALAHFNNIRHELSKNGLLRADLGPFTAEKGEDSYSIELKSLKAKIMCVARRHPLRGLRHGAVRPDLIICDDLENSESAKDPDARKELWRWFLDEVMQLGSTGTQIIVLGNFLHPECFLMRLREYAGEKPSERIFRAYPFADDHGRLLWRAKYSSVKKVMDLKYSTDIHLWARDYLLKWLPHSVEILQEHDDHLKELAAREQIDPDGLGFWKMQLEETQCAACGKREHQKPLIAEMERFRISAPLIAEETYTSVFSCCFFNSLGNIGPYGLFSHFDDGNFVSSLYVSTTKHHGAGCFPHWP